MKFKATFQSRPGGFVRSVTIESDPTRAQADAWAELARLTCRTVSDARRVYKLQFIEAE